MFKNYSFYTYCIVIPIFLFGFFSVPLLYQVDYSLSLTTEGYKLFLNDFKFPLFLFGTIIPITTVYIANYRTKHLAATIFMNEALILEKKQNIYNNTYNNMKQMYSKYENKFTKLGISFNNFFISWFGTKSEFDGNLKRDISKLKDPLIVLEKEIGDFVETLNTRSKEEINKFNLELQNKFKRIIKHENYITNLTSIDSPEHVKNSVFLFIQIIYAFDGTYLNTLSIYEKNFLRTDNY